MMRLIQKLDKFDTNKQELDQISKINDGKIVPMLFYTAYLNGIDCQKCTVLPALFSV
jgi:hypothetical protein